MTPIELLLCAFLVLVSAFLSSSEVALFSLSRFQLRSFKERFRSAHRRMKRLLADPGGLLISILVTNEVINISLSTIIARAVSRHWETTRPETSATGLPEWAWQMVVGTLITTPIVLFFCEITPKVVAARGNRIIAPLTVGPLSWVYDVLKPVRLLLKRLVLGISRLIGHESGNFGGEETNKILLKEKEFLFMVEEGHKEGAIQENEMELIRKVLELDDTRVSDVYTPLSQVYSLPENTTVRAALSAMRAKRYSRIPVTGPSKKKIIGVLFSKDLLFMKLDSESAPETISGLAKRSLTVPVSMRLNVLFKRMKEHKTHLAVVENASGEALGIVTMADVLDALFEDLLAEDKE